MKGYNAEDEDERENQNDDGINLETRRLIGVQPYLTIYVSTSGPWALFGRSHVNELCISLVVIHDYYTR